MAHLSVANQVDDYVLIILLTVLSSQLESCRDVFEGIGVNVENWSLNGFGKICAVGSRSALAWNSGESDLVVHNDMNRSTNTIVSETLHLDSFIDDTLSRE